MTPHRRPGTYKIRVDLHAHTRRSPDAILEPAELVQRARDSGLHRMAVTDHGEIAPDLVIVGEEIRCRGYTELIGLFLSERIPMGLPIEEVAERIRDQDGIVYAPHPFACYSHQKTQRVRRYSIGGNPHRQDRDPSGLPNLAMQSLRGLRISAS